MKVERVEEWQRVRAVIAPKALAFLTCTPRRESPLDRFVIRAPWPCKLFVAGLEVSGVQQFLPRHELDAEIFSEVAIAPTLTLPTQYAGQQCVLELLNKDDRPLSVMVEFHWKREQGDGRS